MVRSLIAYLPMRPTLVPRVGRDERPAGCLMSCDKELSNPASAGSQEQGNAGLPPVLGTSFTYSGQR